MALIHTFQHDLIGTVVLRNATPHDAVALEHLAREFSNQLGFVPRQAIRDHIARGNYYLLTVNGQSAAFIMSGGGVHRSYRLIQVAVTEELWLNGLGHLLLDAARHRANDCLHPSMTAAVRANNPACQAFQATGARLLHVTHPPSARKQPVNHYLWQPITATTGL